MRWFLEHSNGIALVFSWTDTRWFHEVASHGLLCFLRGRLRFLRPGGTEAGTPGAGSLLIALGGKAERVLVKSGLGLCCVAREGPDTFWSQARETRARRNAKRGRGEHGDSHYERD